MPKKPSRAELNTAHRKKPTDAEVDAAPELTTEQRAELDRRMAEHERDPSSSIPWEVVRARLRSRPKL